MNSSTKKMMVEMSQFCTLIGADPLLVQGGGGNISWKDNNLLWVKASGKCLAAAEKEDIFVPVNLTQLRIEIGNKNFSAAPIVEGQSCLRPSIETMLHALMPQAIIVHLHAVDILAFLVRKNASENIKQLIGDSIEWIFVDYFKPGADLAKAISEKLILSPKANVVFLKNHGLIIGGEDLKSIQCALDVIFTQLKINLNSDTFKSSPRELKTSPIIYDYILSPDIEISRLATDPTLTKRLEAEWSLYPDHVVFLGSEACIVENTHQFNLIEKSAIKPIFIFFIGHGVFESPNVTSAQRAQLRCYFDVIVRQPINESLNPLSKAQIAELLDWDAEQYRQIISLKS